MSPNKVGLSAFSTCWTNNYCVDFHLVFQFLSDTSVSHRRLKRIALYFSIYKCKYTALEAKLANSM